MALARAIAAKIDAEGPEYGIDRARETNRRWREQSSSRLHEEWAGILREGWQAARAALLDESDTGARLRQNNPFCGVLSPRERWAIYRNFRRHET